MVQPLALSCWPSTALCRGRQDSRLSARLTAPASKLQVGLWEQCGGKSSGCGKNGPDPGLCCPEVGGAPGGLRGYCGVCSRANSCCQQPVRLLNGRGRPPQGSTCSYVTEWYWHCKAYTPSGGSSGSGSGSSGSGSGSSCKQVGCRLGVQAPGACRDGQAGGRPGAGSHIARAMARCGPLGDPEHGFGLADLVDVQIR